MDDNHVAAVTARRVSGALALVAAVTAAASFFFWGVFERDVPMGVGNLRGTALTILVIALPLMILAMRAAGVGSVRGRLVWLACLAYLAYNAFMFCFASHFSAYFLLFTTMLGLSSWSLVTLVRTIDPDAVAAAAERVPARAIAVYLLACMAFFAFAWLSDIVPAMVRGTVPAVLEELALTQNTVWVLDFAFTFPLMTLGGVWLWQRRAWGYVVGGTMVIMLTLETAGVAIDQAFGRLHDPGASVAAIPLMVALTVAGLAASGAFLGRLDVDAVRARRRAREAQPASVTVLVTPSGAPRSDPRG